MQSRALRCAVHIGRSGGSCSVTESLTKPWLQVEATCGSAGRGAGSGIVVAEALSVGPSLRCEALRCFVLCPQATVQAAALVHRAGVYVADVSRPGL
ncbi:hypothetical protein NDU88_004476 [Pleurodeles waltl]|uniref:Uncharacterized protein n=1 Tax=Pleurodeles waltl TaxID=8319 RepID=A0AAV7V4J9_PLEWA|nr:hypothetical protein NDU88_004476 [Pleurodeles waltl]